MQNQKEYSNNSNLGSLYVSADQITQGLSFTTLNPS